MDLSADREDKLRRACRARKKPFHREDLDTHTFDRLVCSLTELLDSASCTDEHM